MSRIALAAAVVAGAVAGAAWLIDEATSKPKKSSSGAAPAVASPASTTDGTTRSASPPPPAGSLVVRGSQASASSKVLVTGGYLILEPAFTGLVLALDARFRSAILPLTPTQSKYLRLKSAAPTSVPVVLYAPQRAAKPAFYELSWDAAPPADGSTAGGWKLRATEVGQEKNKFVEQAIVYTLLYLSSIAASPADFREHLGSGWVLYCEGDYQFYSAAKPERQEGSVVPPVVPDGSKTGLGSSAALVSSIVAALFKHFGALEAAVPLSAAAAASHSMTFRALPISSRISLAHNLAQLIHCSAQGKVGSGFDVSTAFFGSQTYRRFTPAVLSECLALASVGASAEATATAASIPRSFLLRQLHDSDAATGWNYLVTPFHLPPGIVVVLADVAGGASTPVMVKKVLAWRKEQKEASDKLWGQLHAANQRVATLFGELSAYATAHELEYKSCRVILAQQPCSSWGSHPAGALPAGQLFCSLSSEFATVRSLLREMGDAAGVDIEPKTQQDLLAATLQAKGVLLAGVPGAGGDDAIFALLLDREAVQGVDAQWAAFQFPAAVAGAEADAQQSRRVVRRLHVGEEKSNILLESVTRDLSQWNLQRSAGPDRANL